MFFLFFTDGRAQTSVQSFPSSNLHVSQTNGFPINYFRFLCLFAARQFAAYRTGLAASLPVLDMGTKRPLTIAGAHQGFGNANISVVTHSKCPYYRKLPYASIDVYEGLDRSRLTYVSSLPWR